MGATIYIHSRLQISSWAGQPGDYVAEADDGRRVLGLGVKYRRGKWRWEVVNIRDQRLRRGTARNAREAQIVAEATAARLLA